jgi:hypothetical protein
MLALQDSPRPQIAKPVAAWPASEARIAGGKIEFVLGFKPAAIERSEEREVTITAGSRELPFKRH